MTRVAVVMLFVVTMIVPSDIGAQGVSVGRFSGDTATDSFSKLDVGFFAVRDAVSSAYTRVGAIVSKLAAVLLLASLGGLIISYAAGIRSFKSILKSEVPAYIFLLLFLFLYKPFTQATLYICTMIGAIGGGGVNGEVMVSAGPASFFAYALRAAKPVYEAMGNVPEFVVGDIRIPDIVRLLLLLVSYVAIVAPFFALSIKFFEVYFKFAAAVAFGALLVPGVIFDKTRFLGEGFLGSLIAHAVEVLIFTFVASVLFTVALRVQGSVPSSGDLPVSLVISSVIFGFVAYKLALELPSMAMELSGGSFKVAA